PVFLAVLRFHLRVGARLALRVMAPAFAAAVGAGTLLGPDFLHTLAGVLYGPGAGRSGTLLVVLAAAAVAETAAPRVCRGLGGWLRHLPAGGVAHRRAAALGIACAELPLLVLLIPLAVHALLGTGGWGRLLPSLAGLPLVALGAALAATLCRRPLLARPAAWAAALLAASGSWPQLAVAAVLLVAADRAAGSLPSGAGRAPDRRLTIRSRLPGGSGVPPASSVRLLEARIAWRALRWRLASAYAAGLFPLAAAALFVANNHLSPPHIALAVRLGGGCAVVFLFAGMGEALAARRPAWPWSRSLPWQASRRTGADAVLLAAHALPLLALAAWIAPLPALAPAAATPLFAALAAGALRRAPERRTGAAGEILMAGLILAGLVALLPWAALLLLAATPRALAAAAERERRQEVSRWLPLHHLAAGDPQSWSAS
ncbi:MAG TPA: hypothetical protein VOA87_12100, partial [Thermoanaerobaculia bacterium]|nr:hypothetical protein [Thermoanaerobaculia bacterium]